MDSERHASGRGGPEVEVAEPQSRELDAIASSDTERHADIESVVDSEDDIVAAIRKMFYKPEVALQYWQESHDRQKLDTTGRAGGLLSGVA